MVSEENSCSKKLTQTHLECIEYFLITTAACILYTVIYAYTIAIMHISVT